jgi:purine-binding chemotaxis protein CheW
VDYTIGVAEYGEQDITLSEELFPGIDYLEGVTKLRDDIIYIYNLDRFLSSEDEAGIESLLSPASPESAEEGS